MWEIWEWTKQWCELQKIYVIGYECRQSFFYNVKNKTLQESYIRSLRYELNQDIFLGKLMGRPACSDRIIYYSSFLSQMIKLNSRQSLTYQHWIQLWAIVTFETDGQLFFTVCYQTGSIISTYWRTISHNVLTMLVTYIIFIVKNLSQGIGVITKDGRIQ